MKEVEMYKLCYNESLLEIKSRDKVIAKLKEDLNREKIKNQQVAVENPQIFVTGPEGAFGPENGIGIGIAGSLASMDEEKLTQFKDIAEKYLLEVVDDLPVRSVAECKVFFEIFR